MRFLRLLSVAAFVLTIATLSITAQADPIIFTAVLTGSQENPPRISNGTGFGTLVLNGNQATITVSFSGLTTGIQAGHIHQPTTFGANGPVIIPFDGLFTAGATFGLLNAPLTVTLTQSQIDALNAGLLYFNIHTPTFPGGEIRGNISAVPEPGTLALLGTGLALAANKLRKRRKEKTD